MWNNFFFNFSWLAMEKTIKIEDKKLALRRSLQRSKNISTSKSFQGDINQTLNWLRFYTMKFITFQYQWKKFVAWYSKNPLKFTSSFNGRSIHTVYENTIISPKTAKPSDRNFKYVYPKVSYSALKIQRSRHTELKTVMPWMGNCSSMGNGHVTPVAKVMDISHGKFGGLIMVTICDICYLCRYNLFEWI